MTNKLMKAAMALTVAGAVALPAGQAAAATRSESALLGALIGGVAGAAIGDGKTEGVVLGAVAGAALGAAVDSNNDHRRYRNGYSYRTSRPYARDTRYRSYEPRRGYYDQGYSQGYYGRGSSYDRDDGYRYDSYRRY